MKNIINYSRVATLLGLLALFSTAAFANARTAVLTPAGLSSFGLITTSAGIGVSLPSVPSVFMSPMLAQAAPTPPIDAFLDFLAYLLLAIGSVMVAYGGFQISRGQTIEGLMSCVGGLVLALAIPFMRWLLHITGAMN